MASSVVGGEGSAASGPGFVAGRWVTSRTKPQVHMRRGASSHQNQRPRLVGEALGPLLPGKLNGVSGELPALIESAVQARKDKLHSELEERMSRMEARKLGNKELPQLEEWRELLTLRGLYRQACESGSHGDHSLAHSIIRDKLVNFAVWLYNVRVEKPVANAVFRLLEAEAVALGDSDAEKLNKKNGACDL